MSATKNIDPEDLMLYAMQSLGTGETAEIAEYLEQNAGARRELAEIQGDLAGFALTTEMIAPRAQARTRFLKTMAEEQNGVARGARQTRGLTAADVDGGAIPIDTYRAARQEAVPARRGVAARVLPWAGWAVAAGMAVAAAQLYRERQGLLDTVAGEQARVTGAQAKLKGEQAKVTDEQSELTKTEADAARAREVLSALNDKTAMQVSLTKKGVPASPTGRTTYSSEKGVLIFTASNLEPLGTFKVYELWLIPANGGPAIPAGTFHPDAKGYANLVSTKMPKGVEAKAFGITVEDDGGAKAPTPPILMTGA